jgi:Cu2+-containing amine oxidase
VNHISEFNVKKETEGPHNPSDNAFYYEETLLDSELKVSD